MEIMEREARELKSPEEELKSFLTFVGSTSHKTDKTLSETFWTFVNDMQGTLFYRYEQVIIDTWLSIHEMRNSQANNNCRYFLHKFMAYMGSIGYPQDHLDLKPLQALPPPIDRPTLNDEKKIDIYKAIIGREWRMTVKGEKDVWIDADEILWCTKLADVGGLRISEVIKAREVDFVIEEGVCKLKIIKSKGNKSRKIFIPINFYNELVNLYIKPRGLLSGDKLFKSLDTINLARIFERACIIAGFYRITTYKRNRVVGGVEKEYVGTKKRSIFSFHDLRRARAVKMDEEGYSLTDIRIFLGHSNISTTQRYINKEEQIVMKNMSEKHREKRRKALLSEGYDADDIDNMFTDEVLSAMGAIND